MHFRNPLRSIPSGLWLDKTASSLFCSGIFSFRCLQTMCCAFSVHRAELRFLGFIPRELFWCGVDKTILRWFTLVCVSKGHSLSGSFEELAMPLFERLNNFECPFEIGRAHV